MIMMGCASGVLKWTGKRAPNESFHVIETHRLKGWTESLSCFCSEHFWQALCWWILFLHIYDMISEHVVVIVSK